MLGAAYGSVCTELDAFVQGNDMIQKVIGAAGGGLLLDHYIAMIYMVMSMVVSVPAALTALRIHNEEKRGRLEQIFAKAAPRGNLYGCFILIAVVESAVMEGLLSAGLWAASGGALNFGFPAESRPLLPSGDLDDGGTGRFAGWLFARTVRACVGDVWLYVHRYVFWACDGRARMDDEDYPVWQHPPTAR